MTVTVDALYDSLGDLTKTLFIFKANAVRLNEELTTLDARSAAYRAKQLERDVAQRNWEHTEQACEAYKRQIERLERERPEPAPSRERQVSDSEIDTLLGLSPATAQEPDRIADRDDFDRDR